MIEKTDNNLVVIASSPQELAEGQQALIEDVKRKEQSADQDIRSANELVKHCDEAHITSAHAKRLRNRALSRKMFLAKVREALEAGYVIMPNFPARTIIIRTDRDKPKRELHSNDRWEPRTILPSAAILPVGEGENVRGDTVYVNKNSYKVADPNNPTQQITRHEKWNTGFVKELGLPIDFMKPTIVQMTGKAAARKIFDEICVVDRVGVDPLVVGIVIDKATKKRISFLIAWFVDTKDI